MHRLKPAEAFRRPKNHNDSSREQNTADNEARTNGDFHEPPDEMQAEEQNQSAGQRRQNVSMALQKSADRACRSAKADENNGEPNNKRERGSEQASARAFLLL